MGRPAERWFTPLVPGEYQPALKYRGATGAAVAMGRFCGSPFPRPEPVPLDEGVLAWVEDNTDVRERAPLTNLLKYVLTRSQQQLGEEVDASVVPPRTGPQGVGIDRKHVEQLSAFMKEHRGAVHAVDGELLDSFPRVLEDERYPVGLVEEAFVLDRRKQVWIWTRRLVDWVRLWVWSWWP